MITLKKSHFAGRFVLLGLLLVLSVSTAPSQATPLPLTQNLSGPDWNLTLTSSEAPPGIGSAVVVNLDLTWYGELDSYDFTSRFSIYNNVPGDDWPGWEASVSQLHSTLRVNLKAPLADVSIEFFSPEPQPVPSAALIFGAGMLVVWRRCARPRPCRAAVGPRGQR